MDKKIIGEKLKFLRILKNLSMDKLKDEFNEKYGSNVSKSMISNWENGRHLISNKNLNLYVKYFDIPLSYFTDNDILPSPYKLVNIDSTKVAKSIEKFYENDELKNRKLLIDFVNSDKALKFNLVNEIVDCLEVMNTNGLQKVLNYSKDILKIEQYKSEDKED